MQRKDARDEHNYTRITNGSPDPLNTTKDYGVLSPTGGAKSPLNVDYIHQKYINDQNKIFEIQQTRRILEIVNPETLKKAITKEVMGRKSNTMKDKLSRYVFKNNQAI
jgi:hypothetical protein